MHIDDLASLLAASCFQALPQGFFLGLGATRMTICHANALLPGFHVAAVVPCNGSPAIRPAKQGPSRLRRRRSAVALMERRRWIGWRWHACTAHIGHPDGTAWRLRRCLTGSNRQAKCKSMPLHVELLLSVLTASCRSTLDALLGRALWLKSMSGLASLLAGPPLATACPAWGPG